MPSDAIAVSVRNLTKTYRLFGHPGDRVKQFLSLGLKQYHRAFTALKDASLDIKKGETVGIIGRNGSGKSTLLQLICGILKPTSGTISINGRISALLELGAGFNPEFTGRENVYFHGTLMGFTKAQMDVRFDAITAFADIGDFIDQPVRTYSSGMFVRLAFSAAIHADADILVVDEALAVGDQAFQSKCLAHMEKLRHGGHTTIIFVSHNIRQVERLCGRALLLDRGVIVSQEKANVACNAYFQHLESGIEESKAVSGRAVLPVSLNGITVHRVTVAPGDLPITSHEPLTVELEIGFPQEAQGLEIIAGIHTDDLVYIVLSSSSQVASLPTLGPGSHIVSCSLSDNVLRPGHYWIGVGIYDQYGRELWRADYVQSFVVSMAGTDMTKLPTSGFVDLPFQWHASRRWPDRTDLD